MWFAQTMDITPVTSFEPAGTDDTGFAAYLMALWFVWLTVVILMIVAQWKVFTKAGEAGWKVLIPFYNAYTLFRIAGRNGWWFLGLFVPLVNLFVTIMLSIDLAKHFGKSTVFGIVALWLFSIVGYFMLGYGDAEYVGPKHD